MVGALRRLAAGTAAFTVSPGPVNKRVSSLPDSRSTSPLTRPGGGRTRPQPAPQLRQLDAGTYFLAGGKAGRMGHGHSTLAADAS